MYYYKFITKLIDEPNDTRWKLKYISIGDLYIETYLSTILVNCFHCLIRSCGVQYTISLYLFIRAKLQPIMRFI